MTSSLMRSKQIEKGHGWSFNWERLALASGILFVAVQIATLAFTAVFFATTHPPMDAAIAADYGIEIPLTPDR